MWDDDQHRERWQDNQSLVLASGVAALALIGLLVFAVLRVADDSADPPDVRYPDTSATDVTTSFTTSSSSTSYPVPSVQTSEFVPAPVVPPPDATVGGDSPSTVDTPTTIYNPYAPTPSTGSAGRI